MENFPFFLRFIWRLNSLGPFCEWIYIYLAFLCPGLFMQISLLYWLPFIQFFFLLFYDVLNTLCRRLDCLHYSEYIFLIFMCLCVLIGFNNYFTSFEFCGQLLVEFLIKVTNWFYPPPDYSVDVGFLEFSGFW